jgi:SAM-dependent methyltransferase
MKLSDLVQFKNRLNETLSVYGIQQAIDHLNEDLRNVITGDVEMHHNEYVQQIMHRLVAVRDELEQLQSSLANQTRLANEEIEGMSREFYVRNYDLELAYSDAQSIREVRKLYIPERAVDTFITRIGKYVDWKYPMLEMGCRDGDMTKHLVAGDPLYVVDNFNEFLDVTVNQFNDDYKHRVRPYLIDDETINFDELPKDQFGFVFSFNYFNYRSMQSIKDYLREIFTLLRPGGVMMFTYNNADLAPAAAYAESYFMSYMPKSVLIPLVRSLGYDIITDFDFNPAFSWLEIRKPGDLYSIKAHQALARVLDMDKRSA